MKQIHCCWLHRSPTWSGLSVVLTLLCACWTSTAFGVTIVKPKPHTPLSGIAQIWAVASPDEKCAYAVLCVDDQGRCVTNMQPIRFDLDTTKFTNGEHQIMVNIADLGGAFGSSKPISVIFANGGNGDFPLPASPMNPLQAGKTAGKATAKATTKPGATTVANTPAATTKPVTLVIVKAPITSAPPNAIPAVTVPATKPATPVTKPATPALETPEVKPDTLVVAEKPAHVLYGPYNLMPSVSSHVKPVDVKLAHALVEPFQEKFITRDNFPAPRPDRRGPLTVVLDGKPMLFSVTPVVDHGNLLVLLRPLVYAANGTIDWDDAKQLVYAIVKQHRMTFTPNKNVVKVDDRDVTIERPVVVANGYTTVPVSIWRDLFGGTVAYDPDFGCVCLQSIETEKRASLPK